MLNKDIERVFYSEEELQNRISELGSQLSQDYQDSLPLMVGILKGSVPFMADLIKRMDCQLEMDSMDVSSYHGGLESTGKVTIEKDLGTSVKDRDIIIVEDIIDSDVPCVMLWIY